MNQKEPSRFRSSGRKRKKRLSCGRGSVISSVASEPPVAEAAKYARSVPKSFIAKNGHDVTAKFIEYARPIVGDLPPCEIF